MNASRFLLACAGICATAWAPAALAQDADRGEGLDALMRMSLEELSNVEVTSVSKLAQSLSTAPASIYVITREEILRTGLFRFED